MIDIQGRHLYQWDIDREVRIKPRSVINEVHFAHVNDAEALVLEANITEDGFYTANIPNILLQSAENIVIYAVNNDITVGKYTVNVVEREKPADYVYTETEVKRWEDLEKRVIDGIGYYKPIVDDNGNLSWEASNDKFPTVETVNIKGDKGDKGDIGERGPQGIQGEKGDKGDRGETGPQGPKGANGANGTNGLNGKDGHTPQKGVDYFTDEDIAGLNIPSVDQTYNPESQNAQSGKAVAEAVAIEQKRSDNTFANALKGNKSDTAMLLDDVSPVTHEMSVKISSDTVTDLTAVKVSRCGKNLFDKDMSFTDENYLPNQNYNSTYFIQLLPNTTYYVKTFNPLAPSYVGYTFINNRPNVASSVSTAVCVSGIYSTAENDWHIDNYITTDNSGKLYIGNNKSLADLKKAVQEANIQIELGSTATYYEPYITPTDYTPTADGTVNGITSLYPNTTLTTDTDGVIIDCEYNRDINKAFAALEAAIATNNS